MPDTPHEYEVMTDDGIIIIEAYTPCHAARLAEDEGYQTLSYHPVQLLPKLEL